MCARQNEDSNVSEKNEEKKKERKLIKQKNINVAVFQWFTQIHYKHDTPLCITLCDWQLFSILGN